MDRRRIERWGTVGLAVVLLASVVVTAAWSDGFRITAVDLNEAGVWVTSHARGKTGRINTQIHAVEVSFDSDAAMDVAQSEDSVVLVDGTGEDWRMYPVDVATARRGDAVPVPGGSIVDLRGPTGIVADVGAGSLWIAGREAIGTLDVSKAKPTATVEPGFVPAVGVTGEVATYVPGADEAMVFDAEGGSRAVSIGSPATEPEITLVGTTVVVLDRSSGRLSIGGGREVDLDDVGTGIRLQLPGPPSSSVLVSSSEGLTDVDLSSGSATRISDRGSDDAVRPVRSGRCAYGAWAGADLTTRACEGGEPLEKDLGLRGADADLRFRINRDRVVLNDVEGETSWVYSEDDAVAVANWDEAQDRDNADREQESTDIEQEEEQACAAAPPTPAVQDFEVGTRRDRPVVVQVLDHVSSDECDVVVVSSVSDVSEGAEVAIVDRGTALQVTPVPASDAPVTFSYSVEGLDGKAVSARGRVVIRSEEENHPPKLPEPPETTVVEAGQTVRHDVLRSARDSDGDALALVSASAPDGGRVTFFANGQIVYTPDPGAVPGTKRINFRVEDERTASKDGRLNVVVRPSSDGANAAPKARSDRLEVVVGETATINLLANDTDPNGDPLVVEVLEQPTELSAKLDSGSGEVSITPTRAKVFALRYTITDSEGAKSSAALRVEAVEREESGPVAVRDDVVARSAVPVMVDLVANDVDRTGDVLAVSEVLPPEGSKLRVELLDMRVARVTALADFDRAEVVRYTVTDGKQESRGALLVRPFRQPPTPQDPVTAADRASVEVDNLVTVPVLANDVDPNGEQLSIAEVSGLPEAAGQAFVQGEQIRVLAGSTPGSHVLTYTATSPSGGLATGELTLEILPSETPNRPPGPVASVEARVLQGRSVAVRLPLIGMDPDGDAVAIVGISEPAGQGVAEISAEGFRYTPDRDVTGTDTFAFTVRDPDGAEATGRVRIVIAPRPGANGRPIAVPDAMTVQAGTSRSVAPLANDRDPDGDELTLVERPGAMGEPRRGSVEIVDGRVVYTAPASVPAGGATDVFEYTVTDGASGEAVGAVTVEITEDAPENEPPIARDDFEKVQRPEASIVVDVLANDVDPDDPVVPLKVRVPKQPVGAEAKVRPDGKIEVTLGASSVAFVYEVSDAGGARAHAIVQVPVVTRQPPIAPDLRLEDLRAGATTPRIDLLAEASDPQDRPVSFELVDDERGGTVAVVDAERGIVTFTAPPDGGGDAGFTYRIRAEEDTAVGTVRVKVVPTVKPPPVWQVSPVTLRAGASLALDLDRLARDPLGQPLTFTGPVARGGGGIDATRAGRILTIAASADAAGQTASIGVAADDGVNEPVPVEIQVTVEDEASPPPVANPDAAETKPGQAVTIAVLDNDQYRGATPSIAIVGQSGDGSSTLDGRAIRFQPNAGFAGRTQVRYQLTDEAGRTAQATVTVTVTGPPGAPSAPTGVASAGAVRLAWLRPTENGAGVASYVVEGDHGATYPSAALSLVVDGLTNGQAYRFRVAALDGDGNQGPFSAWSPSFRPDQVPGAPGTPLVTSADRSIDVSWTAAAAEGSSILTYEVQSNAGTRTVPAADLGLTWSGLANGTHYWFKVRAHNDAGPGPWSATSDSDAEGAVPAGRPGAVPGLSAQRNNFDRAVGGLVDVSWGTPDLNGAPIQSFELEALGPGGRSQVINNGDARSYTMSGLTNGVSYTFRITATNKVGTSDPSTSSASVTTYAVPGVVGAASVTPADQSIEATWSAPSAGGTSQALRYVAEVEGGSSIESTSTSATVTGLTNGRSYRVRVRACSPEFSDGGCGDFGPWSSPVVPYGDPGTPAVVATPEIAGSGESRITWQWNAPDGNGRPISGYEVRLDRGPAEAPAGTTYYRSFPPGEEHTLCVVALNTGSPAGRSEPGCASATTYGRPEAPVVTATPSGRSISWSWNRPASPGARVTHYRLLLGGAQISDSYTSTSYSEEFGYSQRRELCVVAVNDKGLASDQACVNATTPDPPPATMTVSFQEHGCLWHEKQFPADTARWGREFTFTATVVMNGRRASDFTGGNIHRSWTRDSGYRSSANGGAVNVSGDILTISQGGWVGNDTYNIHHTATINVAGQGTLSGEFTWGRPSACP